MRLKLLPPRFKRPRLQPWWKIHDAVRIRQGDGAEVDGYFLGGLRFRHGSVSLVVVRERQGEET